MDKVAFTNHEPKDGESPCPATLRRSAETINKWGGNTARPVSQDEKDGRCSRCKNLIKDYTPYDGGDSFTAGYYIGWSAFFNEGETIVCDDCMWKDPRYIEVYGVRT